MLRTDLLDPIAVPVAMSTDIAVQKPGQNTPFVGLESARQPTGKAKMVATQGCAVLSLCTCDTGDDPLSAQALWIRPERCADRRQRSDHGSSSAVQSRQNCFNARIVRLVATQSEASLEVAPLQLTKQHSV